VRLGLLPACGEKVPEGRMRGDAAMPVLAVAPLTLALSPQAGREDDRALGLFSFPMHALKTSALQPWILFSTTKKERGDG
jgi:hypothetical protein